MKRTRRTSTLGSKKARTSKKPASLMKRVDKKIQKAINKTVEYKLKAFTIGSKALFNIVTAASTALPARNWWILTNNWPLTGAGANLRIGNSLKKCTTYFTIMINPWLNNGTAAGDIIFSVAVRVILFTSAEFIGLTDAIPNFFQFNTEDAGCTTMINPTNKGKVTVLYDKVHQTPLVPQNDAINVNHQFRKRIMIRFSRKFKEVIFDSATDQTPKRPYRQTYIAMFASHEGLEGQYGVMENCVRTYWLD